MRIRVAIALATVLVTGAAVSPAIARPPAHAAQGQSFKVPATRSAKTSYFLSRDTRRSIEDVRLVGPKKSKVTVPPMPAGNYRLLTCAGSHCSATPGQISVSDGPPERTVAFSDSRQLEEKDDNLASSNGLTPALCPTPVAPRRLPSLAGALDAAEKLLADAAGPKGMAQFRASAAYKSAAAAETAAVEAVAVKEPGAALAALLRAHDLEPKEPRYLVGAAAILTSLDHPAEALALIQGADNLTPTRSAPFGINVQALALNAKGAALLALGRFDDAEHYLRAALEIEPLLAEARVNLSIALNCKQKPDALRFLRAGLRRSTTIAPDGTLSVPPVEDQIDVTHGLQATTPTIPIPATFMQMKDAKAFYAGFRDANNARTDALHSRTRELSSLPSGSSSSLLTNQRILGLEQFAYFSRADLKAAQDHALAVHEDTWGKVYRLVEDLRKQSFDWSHAATVACSGIYTEPQHSQCETRVYNENCTGPSERGHQSVVDWIREEEKAERDYIDQFYPWETAIWSNISNPLVQEYWLIQSKLRVETYWSEPFQTLDYWALHARNERCGKAETGNTAALDAPQTPVPEPCPPSVRGVKLAWKLEAVSLEVNCEKVSVEASATVYGWFGVFGQLDWSPRSGKTTVFAGPKVGAKIPGTSIGASFKDGLYVQFGKDGYVGDFGFRTSVSASAGFGPFSIKGGDSMDFSFAPVFGLAR
jgi:tetratricopeptide (TPR) repeat protein